MPESIHGIPQMTSSRTPWTREELALLAELAKRNVSLQIIALKLGRSGAAVDAKAAQQKIALRRMKRRYKRKTPAKSRQVSMTDAEESEAEQTRRAPNRSKGA